MSVELQADCLAGVWAHSMWTHGSSAQRQRWVTTGFEPGRTSSCDTFAAGAS